MPKKNAVNQLKYMEDHFQEMTDYTAMLMCIELHEMISGPKKYLHLVFTEYRGRTYYGVSLEPDPAEMSLRDVSDHLLFFTSLPGDEIDKSIIAMAEHGPWVSGMIPRSVPDSTAFFVRKSTVDELAIVSERNREFLNDAGMAAEVEFLSLSDALLDRRFMFIDDVAFNELRGEFSIGDDRPLWRPAIRELFKKRLPELFRVAVDHAIDMRLLEEIARVEPLFEERDPSHLESWLPFMTAVLPH